MFKFWSPVSNLHLAIYQIVFSFAVSIFLASNATAGIVYLSTLWKNSEVRVCWATQSDLSSACEIGDNFSSTPESNTSFVSSDIGRQRIKNWVNEQYTSDRTGIHFIGWQACSEDPSADVLVFFNEVMQPSQSEGHATIGKCGRGTIKKDGKSWVKLHAFTERENKTSKGITIHEFGHLAGLEHEDFNAPSSQLRYIIEDKKHKMTSNYDSTSIMSYRWLDVIYRSSNININTVGLSDEDVFTLACQYKSQDGGDVLSWP